MQSLNLNSAITSEQIFKSEEIKNEWQSKLLFKIECCKWHFSMQPLRTLPIISEVLRYSKNVAKLCMSFKHRTSCLRKTTPAPYDNETLNKTLIRISLLFALQLIVDYIDFHRSVTVRRLEATD